MTSDAERAQTIAADVKTLHRLGYAQELARRMSGFSNFAISLSIICILAGGITSFHLGFCAAGGAAIGLGWPLVCLFSLSVAAAMGQVASAFPTAGGLYHWAAILGGRGWGWFTAWFNLAGLITVLAAINVGFYEFTLRALLPAVESTLSLQITALVVITLSQALFNHLGIRITSWLTDFSGYLILVIALLLTAALLYYAPTFEWTRLFSFTNFSGVPSAKPVWPPTSSILWLFALSFLLPAYTITGFDASAHTSEETIGAAVNVPRGIVQSVLVSGLAGWIMLCAVVLAAPNVRQAAEQGDRSFFWIVGQVLPNALASALYGGIAVAQYLCGLAALTSASRMMFAFARDEGLPFSGRLREVSPRFRTPAAAIWTAAIVAVLFTVYTPLYSTITAVCVILLYISYVLPIALGCWAYGRTWTVLGPWQIGQWYRPLSIIGVVGSTGLVAIGVAPPNQKAIVILAGILAVLVVYWLGIARRTFPGPPRGVLSMQRQQEIAAAEAAVGQRADPPGSAALGQDALADAHSQANALPALTPARVFVGRSGTALRTATQLALRCDHAAAMDAVHTELDLLRDFGSDFVSQWQLFEVCTLARDKQQFLMRPDLGRRIDEESQQQIRERCWPGADLQLIIGDGLSSAAVAANVPSLVPQLYSRAASAGLSWGQPIAVRFCRVGVLNDIGELLEPAVAVLLIGERPGLATATSLSAYMAYRPRAGDTDAKRNLVSNIHDRGVGAEEAAERIIALALQMIHVRSSGVAIKEEPIKSNVAHLEP